jgi:predicted transcriptional regulator
MDTKILCAIATVARLYPRRVLRNHVNLLCVRESPYFPQGVPPDPTGIVGKDDDVANPRAAFPHTEWHTTHWLECLKNAIAPLPLGLLVHPLSNRTIMVYHDAMALAKRRSKKDVRRSVTLPPDVARQVDTIAKQRRLSDNRVLVELIEQGIEVRQQKQRAFFDLAERFRAASDLEQVQRLGDELGRFVFGE